MDNNFIKLVEEELLNEMPYIEVDQETYDLEIEKYINGNFMGLVDKLQRLIRGEEMVDKYQNALVLNTDEKKQEFIKDLIRQPAAPKMFWMALVHWLRSEAKSF